MGFRAVLTSVIVLTAFGAVGARAEMNLDGPAEVPPASYTGRQFVDSAGCVFVRAGYGSAVNWVPRIDRGRKQLCGYKPTFAEGDKVLDIAKSAPAAVPSAAPAAVTAPPPAATPVLVPPPVVAPAPAPVQTAAAPATRPVSPFERTPLVGAPMPTIALTTTPPRIGRSAVPSDPKPVVTARLPAPPPAPVAPAVARSAYQSPYAYTYAGGRLAPLPLPGESAMLMAEATLPTILRSETIAAPASCPNGAAVAQRYFLSDGRRVLRCSGETADPVGFINGAALPGLTVAGLGPRVPAMPVAASAYAVRAPVMAAGGGYVATPVTTGVQPALTPQQLYARQSPYQARASVPEEVNLRTPTGQTLLAPIGVSTKSYQSGYKPAFNDGRLNPYRGPRDAMSDASMGAIWTNQVPARLVTPQTPSRLRIKVPQETLVGVAAAAPTETVLYTTKSAPAAVRAPAPRMAAAQPVVAVEKQAVARYVQVGSFGVPANAESAKARLRAAGLPVSSGAAGKFTVVYAGPLSGSEAAQALATARGAGFPDAFLR